MSFAYECGVLRQSKGYTHWFIGMSFFSECNCSVFVSECMKLNLTSLLLLRSRQKTRKIMRLQSSSMWRRAVWYICTNISGGICCYVQRTCIPERRISEDWIPNARPCENLICHKGNCVTARAKAWTVFVPWNTAMLGSNPTGGMDVCVCLFCVWVVMCR
jgi:hypothetical protein